MQQTNKGGARYFVLFKDDATRFKMIECIKSKTKDVVLACLKQFTACLRHEIRNMLKFFHNIGEWIHWCWIEEISWIVGNKTKTHNQLYTKIEWCFYERQLNNSGSSRSMVHANNIHIWFWGEVVNTTMYVFNRSGTRTLDNMTHFEARFQIKPPVAHIRVLGSNV